MPNDFVYKNGGSEFSSNEKGIVLIVKLPNSLPEEIQVKGYDFFVKSEFHVSLVCAERIVEKYNIEIPDFDNLIRNDFQDFLKEEKISIVEYCEKFYFVSKEAKKAIVIMCQVSNLDMFFTYINKKYNLNIESPPTHITLYTLKTNGGIYLIDSSDIKNLTEPITMSREIKDFFKSL